MFIFLGSAIWHHFEFFLILLMKNQPYHVFKANINKIIYYFLAFQKIYYLNKFYTNDNLVNSIEKYMDFYNNKRFQAKLKNLPPIEYRSQVLLA